jgi:hypothetical protein
MTDKHRHRHTNVPQGSAPNWVLISLAGFAVALAVLAGKLT